MGDKIIPFLYLLASIFLFCLITWVAPSPIVRVFQEAESTKEAISHQLLYSDSSIEEADGLYAKHLNDSALFLYKKAVIHFREEQNWNGYVKCCIRLGTCYSRTGEKDSASYYLQLAKKISYEKLGMSDIATAQSHFFLGEYFFNWGKPDLALEEFFRSKSILDNYHSPSHPSRSFILDLIGEVYCIYFENGAVSEKYYKEALELRENNGDHNSPGMANNYFNLSKACYLKGDYHKAMSYNNKALGLFSGFEGNFVTHLSNGHNHAGNIYFGLGLFSQAVDQYLKAIEYAGKQRNYSIWLFVNEFNNLGAAYLEMSDLDKGKRSIRRSMEFNQKEMDTLELVKSHLNLGIIWDKQLNPDSAMWNYRRGLDLSYHYYQEKHPSTAQMYQQIAMLLAKQEQLDTALLYVQKSLCQLVPLFDNEKDVYANPDKELVSNNLQLLTLLNEKGALLQKKFRNQPHNLQSLQAALECYLLADNVMKKNRESFEREDAKLFMANAYKSTYDQALHCAYELYTKNPEPAYAQYCYELMEKSKSVLLLEALQNVEAINDAGIPLHLRTEQRDIQSTIAEIDFQLKQEEEKEGARGAFTKRRHQLDSMKLNEERRFEKWKEKLNKEYPQYFNVAYGSKMISLDDVRKKIGPTDVVVEYYWGDSSMYICSISQKEVKVHKIKKFFLINNQLQEYLSFLTSNPHVSDRQSRQFLFEKYTVVSQCLFDSLLAPVLGEPSQSTSSPSLIVVPDGPLCTVPFESLLMDKVHPKEVDYKRLPYLLRHYQVSYAYSCQILFSNPTTLTSSGTTPLFLSYANPSGQDEEEKFSLFLPNAQKLIGLASGLGGKYCVATKQNLKNNSPDYPIIHLYVHAMSDKDNPMKNRLLFKKSEQLNEMDEVYSHEIYRMDFRNKWVVLNACETGVGKHYPGEGVYSMARAFCYAGSKGVVMSLWKIDDGPTFEITKSFYEVLAKVGNVSGAIHSAKLNFLEKQDRLTAHPSYWAGIILMENSCSSPVNYHLMEIGCLLILFFAILLFIKKKRLGSFPKP